MVNMVHIILSNHQLVSMFIVSMTVHIALFERSKSEKALLYVGLHIRYHLSVKLSSTFVYALHISSDFLAETTDKLLFRLF